MQTAYPTSTHKSQVPPPLPPRNRVTNSARPPPVINRELIPPFNDMAGHHDPRTLYTIPNVEAFHIAHGEQSPLNTSGPQTMTLLMVPSTSPFADLSNTQGQNEAPEVDFYLHIHIPPEVDLPLLASNQVYPQHPRSYLIPRSDLSQDGGIFTKIVLPPTARQEDVETFETILAQCTAFMERSPPPTGDNKHKPYNPMEWAAGGNLGGGRTAAGQIVLVDEDDGSVLGELGEGATIVEDPSLGHGSKSMCNRPQPSGSTVLTYFSTCRSRDPAERPSQCPPCIRRLPPHGQAPGLQELFSRAKRRSGLPSNRYRQHQTW